jgi:hypothetical protein
LPFGRSKLEYLADGGTKLGHVSLPAPDQEFRLCANAAAAAYAQRSAYVAYHSRATIDVPTLKRHLVVERAVEARTSDDYAVNQDLPRGARSYGHAWPLNPLFDAISYFRIQNDAKSLRDPLESYVYDVQPITFGEPKASSANVNVVVTTLRNYYATYAPDSTPALAHLQLAPLPALTVGNSSDFYLHDIFIDTATNLPRQVTFTGRDDYLLVIHYTSASGRWIADHVTYEKTLFVPLKVARFHAKIDVNFDSFTFPDKPTDSKLMPTPAK